MGRRAKHLALDGSVVRVQAADSYEVGSAATSVGVYWVDGTPREFTSSYRDFGRDVAADLSLVLQESYSMQGGTLLLGSTNQRWLEVDDTGQRITSLLRLGVWEGERYSIHAHLYGGQSTDLIDLFTRFTILEDEIGIQLRPRTPSAESHQREPMVLKEVPNIGLLDVMALTTQVARTLPRWMGTPVRGGELFTDQVPERGNYYVLVSQSARTVVMPTSDCNHEAVIAGLETLDVTWRRPD
jgi:hypothetical protein